MKRLLVIASCFFVIALSGCGGTASKENAGGNAPDNNSTAELLRVNREVNRAIETGNVDTLKKYIGTDAVDHGGGPNGTDVKGENIIKQLSTIHNDIDNMKMEILQEATNGQYIFTLTHFTGTTNKPAWGMPKGFKMDSKSVDVVRVENGKMKDHWSYMDQAEMMKMMPQGTASQTSTKSTTTVGKDSAK